MPASARSQARRFDGFAALPAKRFRSVSNIRRVIPSDRQALRTMQALSMRRLGVEHYDEDVIEAFIAQIGTMDDTLLHDGT